jgi:hypothetical protein
LRDRFLSLLLTASVVSSQSKKREQAKPAGQTPADQSRQVKAEPNSAFDKALRPEC